MNIISAVDSKLIRPALSIAIVFLLVSQSLLADTVDTRPQLDTLLQSRGMVQKERTVRKPQRVLVSGCNDRGHCHDWYETRNVPVVETYLEYLHATSADVVKVLDIKYQAPVMNSIPPKVHLKSITGKNCTASKQTINTTLALTFQTSQSVTWSRTVTSGSSYTLGLSMNQSFSYGGGTVGQTESGSVTFSRSVSVTDGTQQNWTDTVNASEQVVRDVPPMTQVWGSLQVAEGDMSVQFSAPVIIDGTVDANDNNYVHVSDVLNEAQRTFLVEGAIHATSASGDIVTFYEKKLSDNDCANSKGTFGTETVNGSAAVLPLLKPTKEALTNSALTGFKIDQLTASLENVGDALKKSDTHMAALSKMAMQTTAASATAENEIIAMGYEAEGQHLCKSEKDATYSCHVSGVGYRDCNEAQTSLKSDDCCRRSKVCGPDLQSGEVQCEFGGSSTGFTINYCTQ